MRKMRIDHKTPGMLQTFNTRLLNLNLVVHSPSKDSGPLLFCPSLSNEENLENLQEVVCSNLYTTWKLCSKIAKGGRQHTNCSVPHVRQSFPSWNHLWFYNTVFSFTPTNEYLRLFMCQVLHKLQSAYMWDQHRLCLSLKII